MLKQVFDKLTTLEDHHQLFFAALVLIAVVLFSWGIEKIVEDYVLPHRRHAPIVTYFSAILLGILIFMLTKGILLHVM